jgi:hypothetical protein
MTRFLLAAALVLSFAATAVAQSPILGTPPTYATPAPSGVPNEDAIGVRIWAPGLDAGYNPQGLTVADGALYVAAYRSAVRSVTRGPCRVFRIDPASGAETGHFDVPPPCGHAGGLAVAGDGRLYLADTHVLFAIDLGGAFAGGRISGNGRWGRDCRGRLPRRIAARSGSAAMRRTSRAGSSASTPPSSTAPGTARC